jgi:hypothetical protein
MGFYPVLEMKIGLLGERLISEDINLLAVAYSLALHK